MAHSRHYVLQVFQLLHLVKRRYIEFIELLVPIAFAFLLVSLQHHVLVGGVAHVLPADQVSVLIVPKRLFFLSLIVHVQVIFRSIALLSYLAKPSHKLRQTAEHSSHQVFFSDDLVVQNVTEAYDNSGQLIVALETVC